MFYISQNGQVSSAISKEDVRKLFASGKINPSDLICEVGSSEWHSVTTFSLFDDLRKANSPHSPPPPPPPPGGAAQDSGSPVTPGASVSPSSTSGLEWLIPVERSALAVITGYLALFGIVIPPLAILSLILGILALLEIKKSNASTNPKKPRLRGRGRAIFGIVVGAIWLPLIVAYVLIALLTGA